MPINFTTPVGLVRLNITDLDENAPLLSDDMITGLLVASDENVNRATARALRIIATSEVLVAKKIRTQDLSSDGPAVAAELRAQADEYDGHANTEDGEASFIGYVAPGLSGRHEAEEYGRWPW
ncbi:hypothetical protein [Citricoccus sp. K5]|uniref:hypothetical protein n=1 Tax=Citricoccus sp. K5 TaxID=2653135 RepID=UPI0012EFE528|nr:hypothetical protein [Citricoccus sp. K5]VXA92505.1 hypothetical protein CITRIK5_100023 [Citricoccus sp. K5]VXA94781.1 hypothetical protein CITRIK5_100089 [Citricoccus sp. K5]